MGKHRIPVVIVAGFLGSGKTTLLNHLLHRSGGTRVGVVVNDFGAINIDALAVAGQVDSMVSLGNGCLCCAVDTSELDSMLTRLTRPQARIDVIVIEASGIAEPQEVLRMVLASGNERIAYGGLVQVVDAAEFDATRARHPRVERHLRLADLVVLNKSDRVEPEALREAAALVGRLGEGVPVLTTSHGRVDPGLLFDARGRTEDGAGAGIGRQLSFEDLVAGGIGGDGGGHEGHVHAQYDSVEFVSQRPLHPRRLMDFLDKRSAGLYRIKGIVHFGVPGHRQRFTLHTVGGYLRFQRSRWARGEERATRLVLIGAGIDAEAVRDGLRGCVEPEGAAGAAGEQDMMPVLRFLS